MADKKRALVTGGASGIGAATVRLLVERGVNVVIGDVDRSGGELLASEVGATFLPLDVSSSASWAEMPAVDLAVLNAGVMTGPIPATIDQWTDQRWERIRRVNIDGVVLGVRAMVLSMAAQGGGSIVVTSSQSGLSPLPHDPLYSATKHFVVGLVRSVAGQLGDAVRINAVCPGATDTPIIPSAMRAVAALMDPRHVAGAIVRIAMDEVDTGSAWVVPDQRTEPFRWTFVDISSDLRPGAVGRVPNL